MKYKPKVKRNTQNNHHIFTWNEVRKAIVRIFGEPNTDEEHNFIHSETNWAWRRLPKYILNKERHKAIHQEKEIKDSRTKINPYERIERLKETIFKLERMLKSSNKRIKELNEVLERMWIKRYSKPIKIKNKDKEELLDLFLENRKNKK